MCGVIGIVSHQAVNQDLYDALTAIQHRGQDAAGIMTCDQGRIFIRKGNGLVRDVITAKDMLRLQGNMGIGHVRYPTAGTASATEAQPFYVNSPYGLGIVHNGNLINSEQLKNDLIHGDLRHLNTDSDSELLLNVFAHELQLRGKPNCDVETIFSAVRALQKRVKGAYAAVILIAGIGILAIRDPHGIRPLCYGKKGKDYIIASESVAVQTLSFELIDDVKPGQAVFIDIHGNCHVMPAESDFYNPCLFEYVYLARPDSTIDKIQVYKVRLSLGEKLAEKILREFPQHDIDVVMPIPDTSRGAALPLAQKLGVKYREGFVKNRYIGRTFIMPGQQTRKKSVRQKLNPIELEFRGKNVLLVDDSIVRGTTSKEIIQMARDAGAKKVYFASAAPEVKYPNVYGIDMPSAAELIASVRDVKQICDYIGADWLIYQDLSALIEAARAGNPAITRFEDSVFTGNYVTNDVSAEYLKHLAEFRSDKAKETRSKQQQIIEAYDS